MFASAKTWSTSVFLGVTVTGANSRKEFAESIKEDFLLTAFGVLTVGALGGEASFSLFILTGVL